MNKRFVVKDLRSEGGTTIDFVAKHKKKNFSLFFKATEESHEACLCGFVGDGCFRKLVIPDTLLDYQVTRIGQSALECCEMTSAVIPPTVNTIDHHAFSGCFALKNIELPETIVSIGEGAFQNCENLRKISLPNSLLEIGEDAFWGCSSLSEITIPKTLVSIGREAFWGCKGLTSIAVHKDNKIYDSREDCNAIISTVEDRMVVGCTRTVIPDSVRIIEFAFAGQSDLESMTLPASVVNIGESSFCSCKALKEIIIPNSVKKIGKDAFARCSNLREISIPRSVIEIESRAFGGCENLSDVTIPRSVKSIAINAFEDCPRLLPYPIEGGNPYYDYNASAKKTSEVLDLVESISKTYGINFLNRSNTPTVNKPKSTERDCHLLNKLEKMHKLECLVTSIGTVLNSVFDDTRPSNLKDFNAVFFKAMKYYTKEFFDLGYVRFLNIFNDIPVSDKGSVGFFADFVHFGHDKGKNGYDVVTNQIGKVNVGKNNQLFHGSSLLIDKMLGNCCTLGKSFEYCFKERNPLLPNGFTVYKDPETGSSNPFVSSKNGFPEKVIKEAHRLRGKWFGEWLQSLEACYDEKDNGVTNYCILFGSPAYYRNNVASDKTFRKAVVRAIVGIDSRKEDRNTITQFLQVLQGFLGQLSFNLIVDLAREK
ncbi:MAG: leucine-rich repeat domain-containing protein [Bacteroidales bacterium]|nr:leucine-rich repeat domain-containing protein [Bacteroidales bacterium]